MKALPLIALFALAGVAGAAAETSPPDPLTIADLKFEETSRGVEISTADGRSNVTVDRARLSETSGLGSNGPVRFAIAAEAESDPDVVRQAPDAGR